jgi:hypothetical protein
LEDQITQPAKFAPYELLSLRSFSIRRTAPHIAKKRLQRVSELFRVAFAPTSPPIEQNKKIIERGAQAFCVLEVSCQLCVKIWAVERSEQSNFFHIWHSNNIDKDMEN